MLSIWTCLIICCFVKSKRYKPYPFLKQQILDSFKLKEFANDNFRFNKNGRMFSKWVENNVGKGEIARYEQFLHVKTRACLGRG